MKAAIVTIFSLVSVSAFAHGMGKPGPNNGYVKMPGNYHVELVTDKNNLKIFFLDMTFKPLPITNATAKVTLKGFKEEAIDCTKAAAFFACDTKEANMKKYKEIVVESSKDGEKAAQSVYKLPLSY